ncbi:rab-like protein 3 isoform X2 [Portunus trituberculatus]|uniref:rab-like protein 3 isoform X2 n=1 Tax=Portunus trituberculatus TaxID=210409 RepID=UPI001E1CB623|nr:rab-like protein 3 isoform X2 [Portunus trituberculatus]
MANLANNTMNKVKILVVGDSGVGKTSLVHLICHGEALGNSSWTIGCSVEVRIHEFREGTPSQRPYFVEFWDVGGSGSHRNARHVFYTPVQGIILTHDLTNRKSQVNLHRWLAEVLLREAGGGSGGAGGGRNRSSLLVEDFDAENFGGFAQVPVFVVGTKLDLMGTYRSYNRSRASTIAEECSADEINVNTQDPRSLAPGSSNAVKLSRFLDKVIEKQATLRGEVDREGGGFSYSSSSYYSFPPPPSASSSSSLATTRRAKTSFSSISGPPVMPSSPTSPSSSYLIG